MNTREAGFLLLSSTLGDPERKPLTTAQLHTLNSRVLSMERPDTDRELEAADLIALGYSREMAGRILRLLGDTQQLRYYLNRAKQADCVPLTRASDGYPSILRQRLGIDSPGVLWAKGDVSLLRRPLIALVGSRDIASPNREFAAHAGAEAARQGYVLVSGNARGADRIAQKACLDAGGQVISVVADELHPQKSHENILYLSEDAFDQPFTSIRALSRNRVIHALGEKVLIAQCALGQGGTWSGTVHNLKEGWSPVFCFRDGSQAAVQLQQMGACLVELEELQDLPKMQGANYNFLDKT